MMNTMKKVSSVENRLISEKRLFHHHCDKCNDDAEEVIKYDELGKEICRFITPCRCEEVEQRRLRDINDCLEIEKRSKVGIIKNCGIDDVDEVLSTSIKTHKGNIKAYEFLDKFANNFSSSSNIGVMLYGPAGSGKTLLAKKTMLRILKNEKVSCVGVFESVQRLYDKILASYKQDGPSIEQYLTYLENVDFLILDDLGTEKDNQDSVGKILRLIESRGKKKPTIITTNLNRDDIKSRYGDRILSRLYGYYDIFDVTGVDFRKEQYKKRQRTYAEQDKQEVVF